ncbi:MAG: GNAT family N-acetyltransferase [Acidobacteria bacterium]|nr:GNAT family N-acetyltransferase [Acidobacteriota bacterium]MBU4307260.1 GNAT family N-acetyltransferase [Acidobacteriota bacterium]MBU4405445.1 GNAT family N-acetyltransferase [Acidobacteriota bacterium]MCG2811440.1 GNAT family N-acetyltransferase [Candidatus Aminicenantes bacterium]
MNVEEIEIKVIAVADRNAVKKLYQEAGWWRQEDESAGNGAWIDTLVSQSFCFVGAFSGGEMIGMGRAVSDSVSDAYIQDVVVLKKFRGRGIGAAIIQKIIWFLKNHRIGWIGLIAEPGTQAFYHGLGFALMEGYAPMLLKKKKN